MRPSKLTYYADFVVYPVVIVGLAAAGVARSTWQNRAEWLCAAMAGFVTWTLLEYILHRSVLHRKTYFAPMHAQHHTAPLAYLGTPFWISVFVLAGCFLVPVWLYAGFNVADGLTVGVMLGYWWYGVVHHVIHHRGNRYPGNYFQELRAWLAEYEAEVWDQQLHADALAGRLDTIADQALKDFSENRSTDL